MKILAIAILLQGTFAFASNYIVKFRDDSSFRAAEQGFQTENGVVDTIPQLRAIVVTEKTLKGKALTAMSSSIKYIETDDLVKMSLESPGSFDESKNLWGMTAIHVQEAWPASHGKGIVVAVSDTGVYRSHSDLKKNIWVNAGETGLDETGADKSKNKKDDDGNGYIDDVTGWDFVKKGPAIIDNNYHGTHVAGTIAATQGDGGVVGAAPKARIMASTFLNSSGNGTESGGAKSIVYAVQAGANIINCSWGGEGESQVITEAVEYAQKNNVLIIAAAGNSSLNTDEKPHVPSSIDRDNIISVGATSGKKGTVAWFSNFGPRTVDLAAPGFQILSTYNMMFNSITKTPYTRLSGTSMATPHVSGVAALVWGLRPELSYSQVREILLQSVEPVAFWSGKTVTGGVLRADRALALAAKF